MESTLNNRVEVDDSTAILFCMFTDESTLLFYYHEALTEGNAENIEFLREFIHKRGITLN